MKPRQHNQLTSQLEKQTSFIDKAKGVHGLAYSYKKVRYLDKSTKVTIVCPVHGNFSLLPISHIRGSGCPKCKDAQRPPSKKVLDIHKRKNQRKIRLAEHAASFMAVSNTKHNYKYAYSKVVYKNTITKVTIVCPVHGEFRQTPKNHAKGQGCPMCGGRTHYTTESFVERSKTVQGTVYDYSKTVYEHYHSPVIIGCALHGWFTQTPNNHLAGSGCPKCIAKVTSGIQKRVSKWIAGHTPVITDNRTLLRSNKNKGLELDVYCPDHKLGVEVNGLHWHSEVYKKFDYHYIKALLARRASIDLLQFWEHELKFKSIICKSIIASHLGLSTRYYARKLTIETIPGQQALKFFDDNHLQGCAHSSVCYGLFNGTECLCAMSFGKPRFNKHYEWEIVRFANVVNTTVVGGASRLFKHFIREQGPKSILTYADLRISQGNLYRQLGFTFSHRSKPGYFWHKNLETLTRYKTIKTKLSKVLGDKFNASLSEVANMHNNGWKRVFDAGNLVYTLKL